jgi:MarR family transcriptional regulator, temperature-dependent positive regulator of motility
MPPLLATMKSCLPDDIPFGAVVSLISRSRFVFLNNRLTPLGLSAGQFPVLMLLAKEQNIMQDTLVRHYHLDKGTIARAVRKLEDGGYIRRITDPGNRRAVRLFLTEKGEHAIPLLHAINREWETLISSGLSKEKMTALRSLIHHAAQNSFTILEKNGDPDDDTG